MLSDMKRLIFPLVLEAVFVAACLLLPNKTLYLYFLFYAALIIYFAKDFSFHAQVERFKDVKGFWMPVFFTAVALVLCQTVITKVIMRFVFVPDGRIGIWMPDSYAGVILFGFTTIFMGPLAEALFFRKALVRLPGDKDVTIAVALGSVIISLLLCSLSHATGWLGILEAALLVLPLTVSYLKTRNIYIPMLVHIGFMLYENFPSVVYVIARLSMR